MEREHTNRQTRIVRASADQMVSTVGARDASGDDRRRQVRLISGPAEPDSDVETARRLLRATVDVPVAARILGISRATAYRRCKEYLDTNGDEGLHCIRVSAKRVVVPLATLAELVGCPLAVLVDLLAGLAHAA